jgi:hypothetical protein
MHYFNGSGGRVLPMGACGGAPNVPPLLTVLYRFVDLELQRADHLTASGVFPVPAIARHRRTPDLEAVEPSVT